MQLCLLAAHDSAIALLLNFMVRTGEPAAGDPGMPFSTLMLNACYLLQLQVGAWMKGTFNDRSLPKVTPNSSHPDGILQVSFTRSSRQTGRQAGRH